MEWRVEYLGDEKIVSVKLLGDLDISRFSEMCVEGLSMARKNGTYAILVDASSITKPLPTLDMYHLPKMLEEAGVTRQYRIACLYSKFADDFYFYETVSVNLGFSIQLFKSEDRKKAMAWLTAAERADK